VNIGIGLSWPDISRTWSDGFTALVEGIRIPGFFVQTGKFLKREWLENFSFYFVNIFFCCENFSADPDEKILFKVRLIGSRNSSRG
jgi:hypothetical protein